MTRGISLAFETIAIAVMMIIVIIVLSLIFREQILKVLQLDGPCGHGAYRDHECNDDLMDGSMSCIRSKSLCPEGQYCCKVS